MCFAQTFSLGETGAGGEPPLRTVFLRNASLNSCLHAHEEDGMIAVSERAESGNCDAEERQTGPKMMLRCPGQSHGFPVRRPRRPWRPRLVRRCPSSCVVDRADTKATTRQST